MRDWNVAVADRTSFGASARGVVMVVGRTSLRPCTEKPPPALACSPCGMCGGSHASCSAVDLALAEEDEEEDDEDAAGVDGVLLISL